MEKTSPFSYTPYRLTSSVQPRRTIPGQKALFAKFAQDREESKRISHSVAITHSTSKVSVIDTSSQLINKIQLYNNFNELRLYGEQFPDHHLRKIIEQSKTDESVSLAAANAISILNAKGISFSGMDLSGIRIPNARLLGGIFERVILHGADLSNVNARNGIFRKADLTEAITSGLDLGELPSLNGHREWPETCQFSPDGKYLFSAGPKDVEVVMFDIETGSMQDSFPLKGKLSGVTDLAVSSNGKHLAIKTLHGAVQVWNLQTKETEVLRWETEASTSTGLAFSLDGNLLASCFEKDLTVWNLESKQTSHQRIDSNRRNLIAPVVLPVSKEVFWIVSMDPVITVLNANLDILSSYTFDQKEGVPQLTNTMTQRPSRSFHLGFTNVNVVALSPDGKWLAIGSGIDSIPSRHSTRKESIWVWNCTDLLDKHPSPLFVHEFVGHTDNVSALHFSPDGKHLLSGGVDRNLLVWDLQEGKLIHSYEGSLEAIGKVCYSPDGAMIACCRRSLPGIETNDRKGVKDCGVRIIKTDQNENSSLLERHRSQVECVRFSLDEKQVISIDRIGEFYFRDTLSGRIRTGLKHAGLRAQDVRSICCSCDGQWVAYGNDKGDLWLLHTKKSLPPIPLKGHNQAIHTVASSYTTPWIASAGEEGNVCVWDTVSATLLRSMQVSDSPNKKIKLYDLAFSPDGRFLAAVTYPRIGEQLYIWELSNFTLLHTLPGDHTLAFSPSGRFLATFYRKFGNLCVWDLDTMKETYLEAPTPFEIGRVCFWGEDVLIFGEYNGLAHMWKWQEEDYLGSQRLDSDIHAIAVSKKGELVVGGGDKAIRLWKLRVATSIDNSEELARLQWSSHHISDWSGAKLKGVRGLSGLNRTLLLQKGAQIPLVANPSFSATFFLQSRSFAKEKVPIYALSVMQNGSILSGEGESGRVVLWWPTGGLKQELKGPTKRIAAIAELQSEQVIIASLDRKVYFYDSEGEFLHTQTSFASALLALPTGGYISGNYVDGKIFIWNERSVCTKTLTGHKSRITILTYIEKDLFASGSIDKLVKIWDIASGVCLHTLEGHPTEISAILLLRDNLLLTSSANQVFLWDLAGKLLFQFSAFETALTSIVSVQRLSSDSFICIAKDGQITAWNDQGKKLYYLDPPAPSSIVLSCAAVEGTIALATYDGSIWVYTPSEKIQEGPAITQSEKSTHFSTSLSVEELQATTSLRTAPKKRSMMCMRDVQEQKSEIDESTTPLSLTALPSLPTAPQEESMRELPSVEKIREIAQKSQSQEPKKQPAGCSIQ